MTASTGRGGSLRDAVLRLWLVWVSGFVALAVLSTLLLAGEHMPDGYDAYLQWLSPAMIPTLGLLTAAFVASRAPGNQRRANQEVDSVHGRVAVWASAAYVVFLVLLHLLGYQAHTRGLTLLEWLASTTAIVSMVQTPIVAVLGYFLAFGSAPTRET